MTKRRWGRRLVGLAFLLLLVELALQAAAPVVQRAMARREPEPSPDASLTVLCVGDSNTFGLNLPRIYAYPALLQGRLQPRFRQPVTVANRGVPGHNTALVLDKLPRDLAATKPDLVLVLCGINDAWNTGAEERGLRGLVEQLKLVRLTHVLLSGVTTAAPFEISTDERGEYLVDHGDGPQRVNAGGSGGAVRAGAALQERVRAGLAAILDRCADAGATPVLMTYAEFQGEFAGVNATIRSLAESHDVLLVDHERAFGERFATDGYAALMFNDHHPNGRGYALMAEQVDAVLTRAGWVPQPGAEPVVPRGPDSPDTPAAAATLARQPDGTLRLGGPPHAAFQLLMSRPPQPGEGFDVGAFRVPLPDDEVLRLSRMHPSFSGSLDASGQAIVAVPEPLRAAAGSAGLVACLLLLNDPAAAAASDGAALSGLSPLLVLTD